MKNPTDHSFRFPLRQGNTFELLVNGDRFFPAMLEAIDEARHFIFLEMYLVESGKVADHFIHALIKAADRGARCFLLFDDFGAMKLHGSDRKKLRHANIELQFYNPLRYGELRRSLFRDHRKLLLVDGEIAFVGGTGLTDEFDPNQNKGRAWHEVMLALRGPCVRDWAMLFVETWPTHHPLLQQLVNELEPVTAAGNQLGRVTISQMSSRQEIKRSLIKHIRQADHWVWITTAYFVPSWKIRRALRKAARRGVDVRLMLPGPHTDHPPVRHAGRRFYCSLLCHGVRIFEYQPRFTHAKVYVSDYWCSIGSSNVDRWNLIWNLEANQEIEDQRFVEEVKTMFEEDFSHCHEITLSHWQRRPWHLRLLEWFWGRIDVALQRFSTKQRDRKRR